MQHRVLFDLISNEYHEFVGVCTISQASYIHETLEAFGMADYKPAPTPGETSTALPEHLVNGKNEMYPVLVGELIYMLLTRHDIQFAVSRVCSHMHRNGDIHWQAAKRILRYLQGILS